MVDVDDMIGGANQPLAVSILCFAWDIMLGSRSPFLENCWPVVLTTATK